MYICEGKYDHVWPNLQRPCGHIGTILSYVPCSHICTSVRGSTTMFDPIFKDPVDTLWLFFHMYHIAIYVHLWGEVRQCLTQSSETLWTYCGNCQQIQWHAKQHLQVVSVSKRVWSVENLGKLHVGRKPRISQHPLPKGVRLKKKTKQKRPLPPPTTTTTTK